MQKGLLKSEPGWLSMGQILNSWLGELELRLESSLEMGQDWRQFSGIQVREGGGVNKGRCIGGRLDRA